MATTDVRWRAHPTTSRSNHHRGTAGRSPKRAGPGGNLFGTLMHYSSGPAGVIYGSGYVKVSEWVRVAFIMSIILILIWTVVGGAWMALLGMWN